MTTNRISLPEHIASLPVADNEAVYQLVKRSEINASEVEDASLRSVEVTVLWERAVLHVAHLDDAREFVLAAQAPSLPSPTRLMGPGLAAGAAMMLAGASLGAHGNLALAGVGALASAASLGHGVVTQVRNDQRRTDVSRFVVDADSLGGEDVRVVTREGGATKFVFAPGAKGEVELDGVKRDLTTLVSEGIARPSSERAGAYEVTVLPGGRYRMELAGLVIQARVVATGRKVAGVSRKDVALRAAGAGSAVAVAALLGVMRLASGESSLLMGEDHDARLAELRDFIARQSTQVEAPAEVHEAAANGPTGAAHQGAAGSMGDRASRAHNRRYEIQRTREPPHLTRQPSAREAVASRGILGAVGGPAAMERHSGIIDPWGQMTEAGVGERNANGNINGADVGDAEGFGGIDTLGSGIGGGGHETGIGAGPLGTQGHGNCRPGERCTYGNTRGTQTLGPRASHGPRVEPSHNVDITGTIPPEAIRRVVLRNIGQVNSCYEQGLAVNPRAEGRVAVRFVIAGGGTVMMSGVFSDDVGMPTMSACIANAVRRWSFPVPSSSGPVTVTYPFTLRPAD